jgi:methyl-accepting chemotaxis protein
MTPIEGTMFRYIIDGSSPPDDEEHFSDLGDEEDVSLWDDDAAAAYYTKTFRMASIVQSEEWGTTINSYGPILNSRGEAVGIVGCDLDATEIRQWIRTQVLWQLGIVIAAILLGLIVYVSLLRRITKSFA